jgi:hypothetical protein
MSDNNNIASQLGRESVELDPSIVAALKSQGVNIYTSHATSDIGEDYDERQTELEIREANTLDPAKQPIKRLIWAGIPICLFVGIVSFFMFGRSSKNQVANLDPTIIKQEKPKKDEKDKKIEQLQADLAKKSQSNDIAVVPSSPTPSVTSPDSTSAQASPPTPKVIPSTSVTQVTPLPKPQIVYRDRDRVITQPFKPTPVVLASAQASPPTPKAIPSTPVTQVTAPPKPQIVYRDRDRVITQPFKPTPVVLASAQASPPTPKVIPSTPVTQVTAPPKPQIVYRDRDRVITQPFKPTPVVLASAQASPPTPKVIPSTPSPKPQIVYRDRVIFEPLKPSPVVLASAQASPQSFIPLGNGQQAQRQVKPQRQLLVASEKAFMDNLKSEVKNASATPAGDPLIVGSSTSGHLVATLQFNNSSQSQSQNQEQPMQIVLEQPLRTSNGLGLPKNSVLLFQVSSNPQNGAVTATSGDALVNGKLVPIRKGAISIESANGDPLIAKSYRPGIDGLATADRNNALLAGASAVGDELTKSSATTVIGNGSTVVSQSNNPNILGAIAKGAFGVWSNDQRQRTQNEANRILAAPPIQILPRDTRFLVTVTFPALIGKPLTSNTVTRIVDNEPITEVAALERGYQVISQDPGVDPQLKVRMGELVKAARNGEDLDQAANDIGLSQLITQQVIAMGSTK